MTHLIKSTVRYIVICGGLILWCWCGIESEGGVWNFVKFIATIATALFIIGVIVWAFNSVDEESIDEVKEVEKKDWRIR